jgi:hypothetical protein
MTTLLAAIAPVMLVTTANAQLLPPPGYDHPYAGKLTVVVTKDANEAHWMCKNDKHYACAYRDATSCTIYISPDAVIEALGASPERVRLHEIGHCNGWPGNHPTYYVETPTAEPLIKKAVCTCSCSGGRLQSTCTSVLDIGQCKGACMGSTCIGYCRPDVPIAEQSRIQTEASTDPEQKQ